MTYTKIIKYFEEGISGIEKLLDECQEVFNQIEDYRGKFTANLFVTGDEYKEALNILTGLYLFLEPIYNVAQAYKEIEEDRVYSAIRVAKENNLDEYVDEKLDFKIPIKKVTDNILKVESHRAVAMYIRTRNVFESYVKAVEKAIITVQSQLNRLENISKYKTEE